MHMIRLLACVAAALVSVFPLFAEQLDHWVYESGTISDGVWTLSATLAKNNESDGQQPCRWRLSVRSGISGGAQLREGNQRCRRSDEDLRS